MIVWLGWSSGAMTVALTWMQRAMLADEVELLAEYHASPVFYQDFIDPDILTPENVEDKLIWIKVGVDVTATAGAPGGAR